ncbi:MAG: hypothetical protein PHQ14_10240 [Chromatiales bacterium]|jgi:hypothetical protein|nr:hypothetical protein [Chromatiales bacterium]MDX9768414.1 hypothetical protein [Ectothiorhodospiraceae bacterium]
MQPDAEDARAVLRVEIDAGRLLALLRDSALCAADLRCLDCESRQCLRRMLLRACAEGLAPGTHRPS